jgi:glutaredoxin 3
MITVYTKNVCPYCVKAKNYLENKGIEYETVNIEENQTERNWLMENGFRSVPQIFVNKKLLAWLFSADASKEITIANTQVFCTMDTLKDLADQYVEGTTGITLAKA